MKQYNEIPLYWGTPRLIANSSSEAKVKQQHNCANQARSRRCTSQVVPCDKGLGTGFYMFAKSAKMHLKANGHSFVAAFSSSNYTVLQCGVFGVPESCRNCTDFIYCNLFFPILQGAHGSTYGCSILLT